MRRKVVAGALVVASMAGIGAFGAHTAGAAVGNPGPLTMELVGFVDAPTFGFSLWPDLPAPGTVSPSGSLAFPKQGFVFPTEDFSIYIPSVDPDVDVDVVVRPEMTQDLTGTVNPQTGNMALNGKLQLSMTSVGDHAGVLVNCPIGPFNIGVDEDEGSPYDETSGNAFLLNYSFGIAKIPATAPGCGGAAVVADMNLSLELPVAAGDAYIEFDLYLDPAPGTAPAPTTTTTSTSTSTTIAPTTTTTTTPAGATIAIGDVTVTERDTGQVAAAVFPVTLSSPANARVTVKFATTNGAAIAGTDYVKKTGTVTFSVGQTAKNVTVNVKGDVLGEMTETFTVALSTPTNATVADGSGIGTIIDDDATGMSVDDVTVVEGDGGTKKVLFTIRLSTPAAQRVTGRFTTRSQTALAGTDFVAKNTTFSISVGAQTKTIPVYVKGDVVPELAETFAVDLSNVVNVAVVDGTGIGRITDND